MPPGRHARREGNHPQPSLSTRVPGETIKQSEKLPINDREGAYLPGAGSAGLILLRRSLPDRGKDIVVPKPVGALGVHLVCRTARVDTEPLRDRAEQFRRKLARRQNHLADLRLKRLQLLRERHHASMLLRQCLAQLNGLRFPTCARGFPAVAAPAPPPSAASTAGYAPTAAGCSHAPGRAPAPAPPSPPARLTPPAATPLPTSSPRSQQPRNLVPPQRPQEHPLARNRQPRSTVPAPTRCPTRVVPARRAVGGGPKARRVNERLQNMDRMPVPRLVVPAQPTAQPRKHMARKVRHPNRVQDYKTLLVRNKPQTRAALTVPPTDPTVPGRTAPRRSPRQRAAHDSTLPVAHKMPEALANRRRQAETMKPLQNRMQQNTLRAFRQLNRNRLQRRQRTRKRCRYRPVNLQPKPSRRAPTAAATTRPTQRRKLDQPCPRKSAKQSTRRNVLQPTRTAPPIPALAERKRYLRAAPLEVRRQQPPDNSPRISASSVQPMRRP